jgi:uncharacterized protein (TIGR00369 family)
MRKILNPFVSHNSHDYNCFGCAPKNELGLQLEFWEDGDELMAYWNPKKWLMGYNNVLHGGIQATLMDEIAGWVVLIKCKTAGVTTELNVKYLKPVFISKGKLEIRSKLISQDESLAFISCELFDGEGICCANAMIKYFCYPERIARRKLNYPGINAFFPDSDNPIVD